MMKTELDRSYSDLQTGKTAKLPLRIALRNLVLATLTLAFSVELYSAPGDIQYSREGGDPKELEQFPPSIFPHWVHRINYRCDACHNKIFEMKTGTTTINKDLMEEGKVCSICHNGNEAFDDGFANCNRCHVIKDK